ncbi:MAG: hypothetical protein MUO39_12250 [Steroidobacteraceae bacterium]|nr:hypothetical protein [Steroidobacteraceae bacterium]
MNHRISAGYFARAIALSLAAAIAAGCGGKSEEEVAAKAASATAAAKQAAERAEPVLAGDDRLANAVVVTSKSAAPVDLKYDITTKPAVGQPFEVDLTFLPRLGAESMDVEISAVEGLTLVGDGAIRFENVQAGERYTSKVLAHSDVAGMYYIGVSAKMTTKVQAEVRGFSIPVLIGTPVAEVAPAPAVDASGQAVQSMPATEPAR